MNKKNILLFWSGGKDSSLALSRLKKSEDYNVIGLVTTLDRETNTVRFHGIPESLIVSQAKLLNIPNIRIYLERDASNEMYLDSVIKKLTPFTKKISGIAFGDIHLKDVREFREKMCTKLNLEAIFPLWNEDQKKLIEEFFSTNHQALVTSIDKNLLDNSFLAKEYNRDWISKLPSNIDQMGENGEFHTFATFSPYFKMRIPYSKAIAINDGPYTISTLKEP